MALLLAIVTLLLRLTGLPESVAFYHPMPLVGATPASAEDVYFTTVDGLKLHGWFLRSKSLAPGEPGPVVLHAHGNAGSVAGHSGITAFLPAAGVSVMTFDYRSFGRSQKSSVPLSREALSLDTRAAYQYLLSRPDVDPDRIGAIGISLGGAFASSLTAENPRVRACCLVAAFSSWQEVAFDHARTLGKSLISPGLDPVDSVRAIGSRQILIIQGDRDPVVNFRHSKLLVQAARDGGSNVTFVRVKGASHNDVLSVDTSTKATIAKFFVDSLATPEQKK